MSTRTTSEPVKLSIQASAGSLTGHSGRYEKRLADLGGIYRDGKAFADALADDDGSPVYWVEDLRIEGTGELITGLSVLEPGRIGDEFFMTRGHLHKKPDRAEMYFAVSGHGVMVLEHVDGRAVVVELTAGEAVQIPGYWVHRSVNVGSDRFTTLFCYAADAGQEYGIIADAGGMKQLVVADGDSWTTRANPDHVGYAFRWS